MERSWLPQHVTLLFLACVFTMVDLRPLHPQHPRPKRDEEVYPEENIGLQWHLEGDIVLSRRRNAVSNFHSTWVNRTVPYVMEGLNWEEQRIVEGAMAEIMNKSCLRFLRRTRESDYIKIIKDVGCYSSVGRIGGQQDVDLGPTCYSHGIVIHELMHALGFWHEHSRPDRDQYITIIWDNIAIGHRSNFNKYGDNMIDTLGAPYDYGSVMHYRNNTFAVDRSRITINHTLPLAPGVEMGQRVGLSDIDVIKLRRLYKCNITHCSDPGRPRNGFRNGNSFLVGSAVSYSCQPGCLLYGSRARSCQDQGQWSGHLPSCLPNLSGDLHMCDFDNQHTCGWAPVPGSSLNWTMHFRATPSNRTGPEDDHTMGSAEGWYIYLEASDKRAGQTARLMSPLLHYGTPPAPPVCLLFYYSMYGKGMGTLNVYQRTLGPPESPSAYNDTLLLNVTGEQGSDWKLAALTLPTTQFFSVILEAVVGHSYQSDIAVDDIVIGPCSSLTALEPSQVADAFHCSFDEGLCGIQQDLTDNFDWSRRANQTATHNTGPLCDPLRCASGYYVYTEASAPRRRNDRARLITPLLRGNGARCVTFYWHMFGSSMGSLIIKQLELDGTERLLWSQAGPQTNTWHLQQLDLSNVPALYKLVFEGVIGPSYQSDLAIDDINVWTGSCQDVIRNDCKFERDLCSWHNTGQISWQRNYGNTPTPGTGPTLGRHNVSTEYYLFVESSRTLPNDTAKLKSGELSGNLTGYCLQFWYHMFGSNIGQLSVLARSRSTGLKSSVWQHSGNSGNVWHRQAIYYTSPAQQDFSIIFEARLTGGSQGDIAIDDITVHAGQCETP